MRVHVVDPSAYTPPYDHALCRALALAGTQVTLVTSEFAYADAPVPDGYDRVDAFYRHARGAPGSRLRLAAKLVEHVPDMLRYRRLAERAQPDVVHFQWLTVQPLDVHVLPRRPLVLTAHDLLPREPRPGQLRAQRKLYDAVDAIIVHSDYGRRQLVEQAQVDEAKVHVVYHGAFAHLALTPDAAPLPPELAGSDRRIVLFFGLIRPYKGLDVLLDAWRALDPPDAELWVVGRPRGVDTAPLRATAPASVRFAERFVSDRELPALFRRADLVVLPYKRTQRFDQSGVLFTALAFGKAIVLSDIGGFSEIAAAGAAKLVPPGDAGALAESLGSLLGDEAERRALEGAAASAAGGPYSWDEAARRTLGVYQRVQSPESAP
jgi:glycosyltransferase involved in cell wall biosynthesis